MPESIHGVGITHLNFLYHREGRRLILPPAGEGSNPATTVVHVISPGQIQAWLATAAGGERFACIQGMLQLALFDARRNSPTFGQVMEIFFGEHNPQLLDLQEGVYFGWKNNAPPPAWIVHFHDGRKDFHPVVPWNSGLIPYRWQE